MSNSVKFSSLNIVLLVAVVFLSALSLYLAFEFRETKQNFGENVRQYLLSNPVVIKEAIEILTAHEQEEDNRQKNDLLTTLAPKLKQDGYSFVGGNPDGDVTIVEFFDYRCGYCKRVYPTMMKTVKNDGNVRLVYKEFPILGPESITAAQAAIASIKQNKYEEYHHAMMAGRGKLTVDRIFAIAKELGLDIAQLKLDMASEETRNVIAQNHDLARQLDINGTPAFVIGSKLAPGAISADQMKQLIALARNK